MKIYLATDHAGFEYKEKTKAHLIVAGHEVIDMGAHSLNSVDAYPHYIVRAAQEVAKEPDATRAIVFGGSGQGEGITANRFKGVRAVVYYAENLEIIDLSREHNNANVLSIGARFVSVTATQEAVNRFLEKPFSGDERHMRRIAQLDTLLS